jgi:hypothetical protein
MGRVWLIVWKVELAEKVELGAQRPQYFCAVHSAEPKAASRANMRHVTHQSWARQTVSSQRNLERKWCQPRTVINISAENMIRPAPTATCCQKGGSPTTAVMLTRRGIPAARPEPTVRTRLSGTSEMSTPCPGEDSNTLASAVNTADTGSERFSKPEPCLPTR